MAQMQILRPAGKTYVISVTASSSTAITVNADASNDQVNYATFLNTGTATVAVTVASTAGTNAAAASVLPVAGTPTSTIVLPPSMNFPVAYVVPSCPFSVTAIGSSAGPSLVYIQTVGDQS